MPNILVLMLLKRNDNQFWLSIPQTDQIFIILHRITLLHFSFLILPFFGSNQTNGEFCRKSRNNYQNFIKLSIGVDISLLSWLIWSSAICFQSQNDQQWGTFLDFENNCFVYNKVISLMEGKLKKQDLLKVITDMEIIEKLPKQLLEQLCKIFKVEEISAPQSRLIQHFKNKMVDVFMQEADGYMDYLQLPKFRSLGQEFTEKMHLLFRNVWNQYGESKVREQANITKKEIQQLTPSFDSPEKMEQFHLRLLQIYRESSICPKNAPAFSKPIPERKILPQQPQQNNFLFQNPTLGVNGMNSNIPLTIQPSIFPMFPFSQTPNYPKVQAQDGIPYIIDNKNHNPQPIFDMSRFQPYFSNPTDMFQVNRVQQKIEEVPPKNLFSQTLQSSLTNFIRYEYIQCVCQGKRGIQDKIGFQCSVCNFSYHLYCLKMESNPANNSICPLCILRKETVFCKVISEPIKFNWHLSQRGKELKVEMTDEETHQIYEARKKGKNCQIRFLKINGKSFKKDKKPFEGYINNNGYLQRPAKHTEITLPELVQDKNQKISIEIVLRSQDDQQPNIPKLYLFAVFFISTKEIDQIVSDLFASKNFVTREFYFTLKQHQRSQEVSINLQEGNSSKQIKFPVRGDICKHIEVFDFKYFLQMVNDLRKDNESELNCPHCSAICSYFVYDKQIFSAIQDFPEYDDKKPQGILMKRDGENLWILDEDGQMSPDSIIENENENPNQPMDQQPDDAMQQ